MYVHVNFKYTTATRGFYTWIASHLQIHVAKLESLHKYVRRHDFKTHKIEGHKEQCVMISLLHSYCCTVFAAGMTRFACKLRGHSLIRNTLSLEPCIRVKIFKEKFYLSFSTLLRVCKEN